MVANKKTDFLHLLKKLWRWGALACLINLMHYGVAMGQCTPKVKIISNNAPAGIVQLKRKNTSEFPIYTTVFDMDVTPCNMGKSILISFATKASITLSNVLPARYVGNQNTSCPAAITNTVSTILTNCKDNIGTPSLNGSTDITMGLAVTVTVDVSAACGFGSAGIIFERDPAFRQFNFTSPCSTFRVTYAVNREARDMTLSSGSNTTCLGSTSKCITSGTIDYSEFVIAETSAIRFKQFDLGGFVPPVSIKYSDAPPTCAVTLPPLVVMPKMTPDKVTATTAGQAIPGTTIDLPITLSCQNADNQAKVFTWTFTTPSADGFSILNDPSLNIAGGVTSAGVSAQIFSTVDLTGRDKVVFTENPAIIKNSRSYIATPTSNTTIVPHKVRLIRNSETTKEGTFISKATFTVEYQ